MTLELIAAYTAGETAEWLFYCPEWNSIIMRDNKKNTFEFISEIELLPLYKLKLVDKYFAKYKFSYTNFSTDYKGLKPFMKRYLKMKKLEKL